MGGARSARARLLAAIAVLAAGAAGPAGAGDCAGTERLADGWTRIAAPAFGAGLDTLTGYDVSGASPDHLAATNGSAIATSTDAGCTWTLGDLAADAPPVSDLPLGDGVPVVPQSISQVRFGGGAAPAVWAIGQTDVVIDGTTATRPRVLLGQAGGPAFIAVVDGLPPLGRPVAIRGMFGRAAVLLFQTTAPRVEYAFYATTDGATWQLVWGDQDEQSDFVVDWVSPGAFEQPVVWAWSSNGVLMGKIGELAPRLLPEINGNVQTVDLALTGRDPANLHVFFTGAAERSVSDDGGANFTAAPAPVGVRSASSFHLAPGVRALATESDVLIEAPGRTVDVSPADANVRDVRFGSPVADRGMPLYAFEPRGLYRRTIPLGLLPPRPPAGDGGGTDVDVDVRDRDANLATAAIEPARAAIRLRPGQRKVVDYRVALPPVPTPLDVFFMTDSTGSMRRTIASVQSGVQGIVDGLAETGISVRFGVADFRDYPRDENDRTNYAYRRLREVGPIDTGLEEALESLRTGGGNYTGGHDAGLEAIYQAATGAGRVDVLGRQLVQPGFPAGFRPEAMKVVLVATDDNFRLGGPTDPAYPGPSLDLVSKTLRGKGIYLVGLEVDTNSGSARTEMERLARDTGAVAPDEGVDCDGDGIADVAGGGPIVCTFDPKAGDTIAGAFVQMLAGIEDYAPVDIALRGADRYVRPLGTQHFPSVNVKAKNAFRLPVEFTCTAENAGTETPLRIVAQRAGEEVGATTATFECVAPDPIEPAPPPRPRPPLAVAFVPPPPPPPAPVPNPQPNPNPNPNPQPNPQLNPNAGFATQEEQQVQLALADSTLRLDDELAMTGLDRAGPPLPAVAWAAAFAMTGAAAFGLHRSRRTGVAPARVPRD
ncbi:MAG TPA: vWA domain-containing protein [Frankiaceae bacterium]|nr:vWA domain-containing protein [Frankiaceae bacterium]